MEAIWEAVIIVPVRGVNRRNESENREYFLKFQRTWYLHRNKQN